MTLSPGTVEYTLGTAPVTGCGISWTAEELDTALAGPVAGVVFDDAGNADISALLEGISDTDFEYEEITKILSAETTPQNWEVGEALAEAYLSCHRDCYFPWPDGRDIRKPKSSLPGADMIGFYEIDLYTRFAFGEVKISKQNKYPPNLVRYGKHPLNKQLADLRDRRDLRDKAVIYLGHRAKNTDWEGRYKCAAKNYIRSGSYKIAIFGVLVRDVVPDQIDFQETQRLLSSNCHENTSIELIAIYLPAGSIDSLSKKVVQSRKGGDT